MQMMKRKELDLKGVDLSTDKEFKDFALICNEHSECAVSNRERKAIERQFVTGAYQFMFSKWRRAKVRNRKFKDTYLEMRGLKMLHIYEQDGQLIYAINRLKFD